MARKIIAIFLILLLLLGCAPNYSQHTYLPLKNVFGKKLAVLPFANETVDFDASPVFRYATHNFLRHKGYKVIRNPKVDNLLKEEMGISEGGQLGAFSPQELGKTLNADLLLYGTITEFNTKYALVYSSIQVEGKFKLVETSQGKTIWESTSGSYSNNFSRIFFVGDLIDLLMTLDVKEFVTNNDFVNLFKEDQEHILSDSYLRNNVNYSGNVSASAQINIDHNTGHAIMAGAKTGAEIIKNGLREKEGVIIVIIIFLTWTLLYAIFDNYNNYVVETIIKGFSNFPGLQS